MNWMLFSLRNAPAYWMRVVLPTPSGPSKTNSFPPSITMNFLNSRPGSVSTQSVYVMAKLVSSNQRRKDSLSPNCLNSSVSSFIRLIRTRCNALSCSMRAFCLSEFFFAFWKAVFAATFAGISSVMSFLTRAQDYMSSEIHRLSPMRLIRSHYVVTPAFTCGPAARNVMSRKPSCRPVKCNALLASVAIPA